MGSEWHQWRAAAFRYGREPNVYLGISGQTRNECDVERHFYKFVLSPGAFCDSGSSAGESFLPAPRYTVAFRHEAILNAYPATGWAYGRRLRTVLDLQCGKRSKPSRKRIFVHSFGAIHSLSDTAI